MGVVWNQFQSESTESLVASSSLLLLPQTSTTHSRQSNPHSSVSHARLIRSTNSSVTRRHRGVAQSSVSPPKETTSSLHHQKDVKQHNNDNNNKDDEPVWDVLILGAGAAKLNGMPKIVMVEASDRIGGRMRKHVWEGTKIELGATLVGQPELVQEMVYESQEAFRQSNRKYYDEMPLLFQHAYEGEVSFANSTYVECLGPILEESATSNNSRESPPRQRPELVLNCPISQVDYRQSLVHATCDGTTGGRRFVARHVICTVALSILQQGDIRFDPPLPRALVHDHPGHMWQGIKLFVSFSHPWFRRGHRFCLITCPAETDEGESYFWDYPVENKNRFALAGLILGEPYQRLTQAVSKHGNTKNQTTARKRNIRWTPQVQQQPLWGSTELEVIQWVLQRMERKFQLPVTQYYRSHFLLNWTAHPYIRGTYSSQGLEGPHSLANNKVFLAGEAYPVHENDHGWVHGAIRSGQAAAHRILDLTHPNRPRRSGDSYYRGGNDDDDEDTEEEDKVE